jgi:hypothetical protein
MSGDDERLRAAVHDVAAASGDLNGLVAPWGKAKAQQILTRVLADYVTELNRALATTEGLMYGVDGTTFMRQYEEIWRTKLSLEGS